MKKLFLSATLVVCLFLLTGCEKNNDNLKVVNEKSGNVDKISVLIDNKSYTLILEDNKTVKKLKEILPIDINMNELNGNEFYSYLDQSLPTNTEKPKHINVGDVMLFNDNCLVIFYKSFDTEYSYTRIGHIDNMPRIESNNINLKIEKN